MMTASKLQKCITFGSGLALSAALAMGGYAHESNNTDTHDKTAVTAKESTLTEQEKKEVIDFAYKEAFMRLKSANGHYYGCLFGDDESLTHRLLEDCSKAVDSEGKVSYVPVSCETYHKICHANPPPQDPWSVYYGDILSKKMWWKPVEIKEKEKEKYLIMDNIVDKELGEEYNEKHACDVYVPEVVKNKVSPSEVDELVYKSAKEAIARFKFINSHNYGITYLNADEFSHLAQEHVIKAKDAKGRSIHIFKEECSSDLENDADTKDMHKSISLKLSHKPDSVREAEAKAKVRMDLWLEDVCLRTRNMGTPGRPTVDLLSLDGEPALIPPPDLGIYIDKHHLPAYSTVALMKAHGDEYNPYRDVPGFEEYKDGVDFGPIDPGYGNKSCRHKVRKRKARKQSKSRKP